MKLCAAGQDVHYSKLDAVLKSTSHTAERNKGLKAS